MTDPLQALLQGPAKPILFPPSSRYAGIDTGKLTTVDGKTVVYLRRRFVPSPERFALLQEYTVVEGDRLDNLAAKFIGDPERFWQICDANAAMPAPTGSIDSEIPTATPCRGRQPPSQ